MHFHEETIQINLAQFNVKTGSLLGRKTGQYARSILQLDMVDKWVKDDTNIRMVILFPKDIYNVNDSFLKSFLQDTYKHLGYDTFIARVKFKSENEILSENLKETYYDFVELSKRLTER